MGTLLSSATYACCTQASTPVNILRSDCVTRQRCAHACVRTYAAHTCSRGPHCISHACNRGPALYFARLYRTPSRYRTGAHTCSDTYAHTATHLLTPAQILARCAHLLEEVVEARGPLARAEAGGAGAVVHHEGDALGVHVGAERVHSLNHLHAHTPASSVYAANLYHYTHNYRMQQKQTHSRHVTLRAPSSARVWM
jgi:hypothetical protein